MQPVEPKLAREVKALVALAFRNGPLEDLHAGETCPTCRQDSSFSRITDDEMKIVMKHAVNTLYHLLVLKAVRPMEYDQKIEFGSRYTKTWDDPDLETE